MASKEVSMYSVQDPTSGVSALGVDASGEVKRFNLGSAANRSVGTGAAAIPLNSDLGTAAVEDVQTSLTDTTADRLMKVGAFGLGNTSLATELDADATELATGFYRWDSSTSAGSGPTVGAFMVLHTRRAPGGGESQIWFRDAIAAANLIYHRTRVIGAWSSFYGVISTSEYPSDSAWTTVVSLDNDWTGTVKYIKRAGWVSIVVDIDGSSKTDSIFMTIPAAYRTDFNVESTTTPDGNRLVAAASGNLLSLGTASTIKGSLTYPVL